MATTTENVIFEISLQSYIDQLAAADKNINELKKNQAELRKQTKEGNEEAAKSLQVVNTALKVAQDEYRATARVVEGYAKQKKVEADTTNFANNSINTNRALLKQLTDQYNNTRNPTASFTNTIKRLSDTLKEQESAIGDNRRQVGGYKDAILDAANSLTFMGRSLGGIIDPLKGVAGGFQTFGLSVKGVGAAFSAAGFPLIIAGITALSNILSSFAPIADMVENATVGMGAAFRALIDGRGMQDAYEAAVDLTEALRDLEDTQAAFNLSQEQGRQAVQKLLLQAKDRTLTEERRIQFLERANRIEENNLRESKQRIDDEISSRQNYLQQVTGLTEKQIFLGLNGNAEQQKQLKDRLDQFASFKEEDLKALQDLILEREKLEGESEQLQQLIKNRIADLQADEQKIKDDAATKEIERRNKELERIRKYNDTLTDLELQFDTNERERLINSFQQKLALITGNSERETNLRLVILQEQALALEKFDKEQAEKRKAAIEKRLREESEFVRQITDELIADNQAQEDADTRYIESKERETDAINRLLQLQLENRKYFQQQNLLLTEESIIEDFNLNSKREESFEEFIKRREQQYKADAAEFAQAEATKQQAQQATLNATQSISNSIINLVGQVAEAQGAGAEFAKALAFVQILISQAIAIAQAVAGGASSGTATGPGAIVATPVFIATLVGAVTAVIGSAFSLLARPVPKFAEGGEVITVGGKSHAEGGTLYRGADGNAFEVERGEKIFVLKKTASEQIGMLGAFNQMFGGNSWGGAPVSYAENGGAIQFSDGGFNARAQTNAVNDAIALETAIRRGFNSMPNPVVSVKEIDRVNRIRGNSVTVAEL